MALTKDEWLPIAGIFVVLVIFTTSKNTKIQEKIKKRAYKNIINGVFMMVLISLLFWWYWSKHNRNRMSLINYITFMLAFFGVVFSLVFNSVEIAKLKQICGEEED